MKAFPALILISLIVSLSILASPIKAQEPLNLTIKPDGSVEPSTDLLERNGNKYTFKGDIFGTVWVQTDNVVIDGAGHTLQGRGIYTGMNIDIGILLGGPDLSKRDCRGILVENLRIYNCPTGLYSVGASNNSFIGNYFDNSSIHLQGSASTIGDLIKHNTFAEAGIFVDYNRHGLDVITENNFFDSGIFVDLSDAPRVEKNYWSNYTAKYPNAKQLDNSGIWDTPYVDDTVRGTNVSIDYQPLANPITDFEIPAFSNPNITPSTPLPTASPTATPDAQTINPAMIWVALIVVPAVILVGALIFKRKQQIRCRG